MIRFAAMLRSLVCNRIALGVVLLVLGLALLVFTERADRWRALGEDALGGFVLTGVAAKPGPASNGQLVLAVGAPQVVVPARDVQFGVSVAAPALVRRVEMFQWKEVRVGGRRSYELDWYDHPIDSSKFIDPAGHANPGVFPLTAQRFDSPGVTVAGFKLSPALVGQIPGLAPYAPPLDHVPANMAATFQAHGGVLTSSDDAARPQPGDLRISWMRVAPRYLTVFARDEGGTLVPTRNQAGNPVAQVMVGRLSLTDVLTDAPQPPRFRWARRVLSVLLAWAGVALLLPLWHRHDALLALAIAVVPLALIVLVSWWGVRMPVAIAMAILAIAAALWAGWRWRVRAGVRGS